MGPQKVSIIITYLNNRAALIVRAVQSVLAQAIDGDEIIVIDDGSSDNTQEVLAPFWPGPGTSVPRTPESVPPVTAAFRKRAIRS